jgi:hypothetical protein
MEEEELVHIPKDLIIMPIIKKCELNCRGCTIPQDKYNYTTFVYHNIKTELQSILPWQIFHE